MGRKSCGVWEFQQGHVTNQKVFFRFQPFSTLKSKPEKPQHLNHHPKPRNLEMSTTSDAEIIANLNRFDQVIRQSIQDGTLSAVMKKEKTALVSESAQRVTEDLNTSEKRSSSSPRRKVLVGRLSGRTTRTFSSPTSLWRGRRTAKVPPSSRTNARRWSNSRSNRHRYYRHRHNHHRHLYRHHHRHLYRHQYRHHLQHR